MHWLGCSVGSIGYRGHRKCVGVSRDHAKIRRDTSATETCEASKPSQQLVTIQTAKRRAENLPPTPQKHQHLTGGQE